MKTILLSDTHFGVRNNSITWLKSQIAGLDEVIEYCRRFPANTIRVIHCGDLFDSRSSINPYIVHTVDQKLRTLRNCVSAFYILGGNHDYYSPEESQDYNITSLAFISDAIQKASQDEMYINGGVLIPWFKFHNANSLSDIVSHLPEHVKIIYTHTDLQHLPDELRDIVNKIEIPIISGHIHTPCLKDKKRITIGSCYSINFSDANQPRGFYTIDDDDINTLKFIELKSPIRFYRIYNQDIFEFDTSVLRSYDRVELYLDPDAHSSQEYKEKEREFQNRCDTSIIINSLQMLGESINIREFDFDDIIERTIPEHLRDKFNIIKHRCLTT